MNQRKPDRIKVADIPVEQLAKLPDECRLRDPDSVEVRPDGRVAIWEGTDRGRVGVYLGDVKKKIPEALK